MTGLAVKFMDDDLDGETSIAPRIQNGLAYPLLLMALAAAADAVTAVSMFLAAYSMGMAFRGIDGLAVRLPSGARGYHESVILLAIGGLLFGAREMGSSLLAVLCVQAFDDLKDREADHQAGASTVATRLGAPGAIMIGLIAALGVLYLDYVKLIGTALALGLVWLLEAHPIAKGALSE